MIWYIITRIIIITPLLVTIFVVLYIIVVYKIDGERKRKK